MEKKIYETPQIEVVEVFAEGVFCVSTASHESWDYEDNSGIWN